MNLLRHCISQCTDQKQEIFDQLSCLDTYVKYTYIFLYFVYSGDSAGGNLAAAVSLRLRDEKIKPTVKLQILLYPVVQSVHFDLPSYKENQYDTLLPRDIMVAMWLCYAQGYLSSCRSIQKTFIFMRIQSRVRGGVRDGLRSSFFHFHAVCGKKIAKH